MTREPLSTEQIRRFIMSDDLTYKSDFEPINTIGDGMKFLGWYERDGTFVVHLGNRLLRRFDETTLPDNLKLRIAMINAYKQRDTEPLKPHEFKLKYWADAIPPEMTDFGIALGTEFYVLILPYLAFMDLKGETLTLSGKQT